jgi:hypothetical protein
MNYLIRLPLDLPLGTSFGKNRLLPSLFWVELMQVAFGKCLESKDLVWEATSQDLSDLLNVRKPLHRI